jgi:uncharacterized protein (TIGR02466 family)
MKSYYDDLFSESNLKDKPQQSLMIGDAVTSYLSNKDKQPSRQEHNKEYNQWLNDNLIDIFSNVYGYNSNMIRLIVDNSWSNRQRRSGKTAVHHHKPADWVVNAYLKVPENSGKLILYPPNIDNIPGFEPRKIDVKTDDVLLFPAWMYHGTEVSESDDDRITMSYNIKIDITSLNSHSSYLSNH